MTSPDAVPGQEKLIADSGHSPDEYPDTGAARIALHIGFYSPGRVAHKITCPALVQIADHDTITPRKVALDARKIPQATVRTYDCGHFDPYVEPLFSTVIADQLEFLQPQSRSSKALAESGRRAGGVMLVAQNSRRSAACPDRPCTPPSPALALSRASSHCERPVVPERGTWGCFVPSIFV